MKRKLILLVVTIVFLVGFGVILHSPPSMIDAVTGATPKSKKAAQASAQLEGSYVLGINMMSDGCLLYTSRHYCSRFLKYPRWKLD